MGGTPRAALSIIGFPIHSLPLTAMRAMLRGGIETMAEAGISVVGGHSINDEEPKLGFAVVGTAPRRRITANHGARVGDELVLTKALGGGIAAFAGQIGRASRATLTAMTAAMCRLNRQAAAAMARHPVHAATDVTGFSLLGHLREMVRGSDVAAELDFDAFPLLPGVDRLARHGIIPGGVERNREGVPAEMLDLTALTPAQVALCFCPETSGGLLVCLPAAAARTYRATLRRQGHPALIIGRITGRHPGGRIAVTTTRAPAWGPLPLTPRRAAAATAMASPVRVTTTPPAPAGGSGASCCAGAPADGGGHPPPAATAAGTLVDGVGGLPPPAGGPAFADYLQAIIGAGALDSRTTALISLALSVATRCEVCVQLQTRNARNAGASDAEIAQAVALGIAFGGAPVSMFYAQLAKRCHDQS
jgi:selenide,water dikinase